MYTLLTTMKTGNVGDQLIIESAKNLIKEIKDNVEFLEFSRDADLTENLEEINKTKAIIMPHFGLRDPDMHPQTYRLTKDLNQIKVPLIPIGIGWKGFPGDYETLKTLRYSENTTKFLKYVSNQIDVLLCREYFTCQILANHGITNTVMGGDCAWYDTACIGKQMKRVKNVEKLVFTTPYLPLYLDQAKKIINMLTSLFPKATKYCSFHAGLDVIQTDRELADYAKKQGFEVKDVSNDIKKIEFYQGCDLHVGYRCHGHLAFLRKRIPSILLHEDGRGVGFSYSFGVGGFDAFRRKSNSIFKIIGNVSGKNLIRKQIEADPFVDKKIRQFLEEELKTCFRRYVGLSKFIDETYEKTMKPFVEAIP